MGGQDCDWATIRYNVSDILTYQQEYKIGVDLADEAMKIYIDGHHTISYNMSAVNCLAGSIGFKTFYSDMEVRNLTVANSSTPILSGLGLVWPQVPWGAGLHVSMVSARLPC